MSPRTIYLSMGFGRGLLFAGWAVAGVSWWVADVGLSPLRLILLGTVLRGAIFVAEVPTGVVADVISRKWSVVASWLVVGLAQVLSPVSTVFALLLVWQLLWAVGFTLQSGADTAWVTDEVGAEDDRLVLHHAVAQSVGIVLGTALSIGLTRWSVPGAMQLFGIGSVAFGLVLAAVMNEHGFTRVERGVRATWAAAFRVWRAGASTVRHSAVLAALVGGAVVIGAADETINRLDLKRMAELGLPAADGPEAALWFGLLWMGITVLTIPVIVWTARGIATDDDGRTARLMLGLLAVAAAGVALMAGPWLVPAVFGWIARGVGSEALEPVGVAWTNRQADREVRATVLSFRSQAVALGHTVGGLGLGVVAEVVSISTALAIAAVLIVVAGVPIWSVRRPAVPVDG